MLLCHRLDKTPLLIEHTFKLLDATGSGKLPCISALRPSQSPAETAKKERHDSSPVHKVHAVNHGPLRRTGWLQVSCVHRIPSYPLLHQSHSGKYAERSEERAYSDTGLIGRSGQGPDSEIRADVCKDGNDAQTLQGLQGYLPPLLVESADDGSSDSSTSVIYTHCA